MSNGTLQSLDRGLLVLELLSQAENGLSLQELCDRLTMKPPTMHNLLRTLATRGYVDKTRRPVRYRLGSGPQALVQRQSRRGLLRRVEAMLPRLVQALPMVDQVQYAEAVGGEVLTVLRVDRVQPERMQRPHSTLSAYGSASGLVFHAYWPAEQRDAHRRRYPFEESANALWPSVSALDAYLAQVRQLGYAVPPSSSRSWRMAAPVFGADGQLAGALGAYRSADIAPTDEAEQTCIDTITTSAAELTQSTEQT
ncbi:IclR family transcriptional regulator [Phycisphaerales bacterium AB-hyl4]|uniref:IclR family transcriptional regulator n=1 Tax=Natronomicrosphaera hydrolytica TaxID=3242702 RepID=A0ABV4U6R4_9BACT